VALLAVTELESLAASPTSINIEVSTSTTGRRSMNSRIAVTDDSPWRDGPDTKRLSER